MVSKKSPAVSPEPEPKKEVISITPPKLRLLEITIVGNAPLVTNRFSEKARRAMLETQLGGSTSRSKKVRVPRNPKADFEGSQHVSVDGWWGIPAPAFRNAMISACRLAQITMTLAKQAIFIRSEGLSVDGKPLVRIISDHDPEMNEAEVRNASGVVDLRFRAMWREWSAKVGIVYDADILTASDVTNLMARAGMQVGICEGRPASKSSNGVGWGTFEVEGLALEEAA